MRTAPDNDRVAKKCAAALVKAVNAFPNLLAHSEPEAAARIIADLIKAERARITPEDESGSALAEIIRRINAEPDYPESD